MKPLDYTLYNKVKEKFPPQPGKIIFVSLKPENLEELRGVVFSLEEHQALCNLARQHYSECHAYAAIGGYESEVVYEFCCHEFEQDEDLRTGQVMRLSVGTYNNDPVDIETVKRDLQKLGSGIMSTGNA